MKVETSNEVEVKKEREGVRKECNLGRPRGEETVLETSWLCINFKSGGVLIRQNGRSAPKIRFKVRTMGEKNGVGGPQWGRVPCGMGGS